MNFILLLCLFSENIFSLFLFIIDSICNKDEYTKFMVCGQCILTREFSLIIICEITDKVLL